MTTPTLQQFAEAIARVKERWPDAPRLPNGYAFHTLPQSLQTPGEPVRVKLMYDMDWNEANFASDPLPVPDAAATSLCVTTAMEIGAWWERQDPHVRNARLTPTATGPWFVSVWGGGPGGGSELAASLPSAALAMLGAIAEGGA